MNIAKAHFIGRLGKDPEFKITPGGLEILNFTVAINRGKKSEEVTDWYRCTAFGKLAALCKDSIYKGSRVFVEGDLQTRSYEKDGVTHTITELIAREVIYLDKRGEQPAPTYEKKAPVFKRPAEFNKPQDQPRYTTEDIPF